MGSSGDFRTETSPTPHEGPDGPALQAGLGPGAADADGGLRGGPFIESAVLRRKLARRRAQRQATVGADARGLHPHADAAVEQAAMDSGSPLPGALRERFEGSLGANLSAVRVHTGPSSAAAADAVSAQAYASGQDIHFGAGHYDPASTAGQHLLAHEVAHTVQQQAGPAATQCKLEVSQPDDAAEVEADSAASAMLAGQPAPIATSPAGTGLSRYTAIPVGTQKAGQWQAGMGLRVSDDGLMAIGSAGGSAYDGSHECWAEAGLVASANALLKAAKSVIQLKPVGATLTGDAPNGSGSKTLAKVLPDNSATKTQGNDMEIWADCGKSGRDVMGAGKGTGGGAMTATYQKDNKPGFWDKLWAGLTKSALPATVEKHTAASGPEKMKKEIFQDVLGAATPDEGFQKYQALSPVDKDAFDQKAKINRYADPSVGGGYTISSGGKDVPGHENDTWNFHWGGVVLKSGSDHVTLENYAVGDPSVQNSDWMFQMYGPASKAGQTFQDQHKGTEQHGEAPTTMAVQPK